MPERFLKHKYDPPLETVAELARAVETMRMEVGEDAEMATARVSINYRGRVRSIEVTK